jgi:Fe-S oxidoreductase
MRRHKAGMLRTDFRKGLGKVVYQVPCHLRVQNIGLKTRDLLRLVPDTTVEVIERCSGHDGTYAVKSEFRAASLKIAAPVAQRFAAAAADYHSSDCPMAGHQIASAMSTPPTPIPPMQLLRIAYGI